MKKKNQTSVDFSCFDNHHYFWNYSLLFLTLYLLLSKIDGPVIVVWFNLLLASWILYFVSALSYLCAKLDFLSFVCALSYCYAKLILHCLDFHHSYGFCSSVFDFNHFNLHSSWKIEQKRSNLIRKIKYWIIHSLAQYREQ